MRLIDADELLKKLLPLFNYRTVNREDIKRVVDNMPTVEQKQGYWELINNDYIACGVCGEKLTKNRFPSYCDNCGASMTKGKSLILGAKMDEVTE